MNDSTIYQQSHAELAFLDNPPGRAGYFEEDFGPCKLEGRILYNRAGDDPTILSVHGARGDYTKANPISFGLQKRGHSLLGMNMSGHSPAGVLLPEKTTLGNNILEVERFYGHLGTGRPRTIIGYSLGGTPALELLKNHTGEIDNLVLFYPALYSQRAYDKPYGAEFRDVISAPFSYMHSGALELLQNFKGKLLLIKGEFDGLEPAKYNKPAGTSVGEVIIEGKKYYSPIPKQVIDLIYQAVPAERRQLIEVPGCDHSIILWMRNNPQQAEELVDQIDQFIRST